MILWIVYFYYNYFVYFAPISFRNSKLKEMTDIIVTQKNNVEKLQNDIILLTNSFNQRIENLTKF